VTARLILPLPLRRQIEAEARAAFPRECCGLIEGVRRSDGLRAVKLHPARNLAGEADRFEVDPEAQFAALRTARESGRDVIGCYHSHPNGVAEPSPRDREGAGEDGFVWLIAALAGKDGAVSFAAFAAPDFGALSLAE
jgi:desampylase